MSKGWENKSPYLRNGAR